MAGNLPFVHVLAVVPYQSVRSLGLGVFDRVTGFASYKRNPQESAPLHARDTGCKLTFVGLELLLDAGQRSVIGTPGGRLVSHLFLQPVSALTLVVTAVRQTGTARGQTCRTGTSAETGGAAGGGLLAGETGLAFDKVGLAGYRVLNDTVCVHSVG